eukprot:6910268-Prymnesium_polylepis.1
MEGLLSAFKESSRAVLLAHDQVSSRPHRAPSHACRSWRLSNAGALLDRVRSAGAAGEGGAATRAGAAAERSRA